MSIITFITIPVTTIAACMIFCYFLQVRIKRALQKYQPKFATALGTHAAAMLQTKDFIKAVVKPQDIEQIMPAVEAHLDDFLQNRLKERIPVLAMFIGESTIAKVKGGLLDEIQMMLPVIIGQYADKMLTPDRVSEIVSAEIAAVPSPQFVAVVMQKLKPLFRKMLVAAFLFGITFALLQFSVLTLS